MSISFKRWVKDSNKTTAVLFDEGNLPLYFDKGKNCVLVEGVESSGILRGVTVQPVHSAKKKRPRTSRGNPAPEGAPTPGGDQGTSRTTRARDRSRVQEEQGRYSHDPREFQFMGPQYIANSALEAIGENRTRKRRRFPDMVSDSDS